MPERRKRASRWPPWAGRVGRAALQVVLILAGGLLMALSVDMFLDPNNVVPGGFTAVSIFVNRLTAGQVPVGLMLGIFNVPFLLIGMRILGREFGPKTIFSAIWVSVAIDLLKPYVTPYAALV